MAISMMDLVGSIGNNSLVEVERMGVARMMKHFEIEDPGVV
jgi:hypothetical protein